MATWEDSRKWDVQYASGDTPWGGIPDWVVRAVEEYNPPRMALDLGCGNGEKSIWLAGQGYAVTGIDFSKEAIRLAKEAVPGTVNPKFIVGDLTDPALDFPNGVGLVLDLVSSQFLEKDDQVALFERIAEHLSSDGVVLHDRLEADSEEAPKFVRKLALSHQKFEESLNGLEIVRHEHGKAKNRVATTMHSYVLRKS
jgi:SAM-dependent methyltransferase